jgi:Uma2 family endonuclease
MTVAERYPETFPVPGTVKFPVELHPPDGFDPARPETWPDVDGRLEYVDGRLLYMPPCGQRQAITVKQVVFQVASWEQSHPQFESGTNETGMILGPDVRGADVAVWRASDLDDSRGFTRVPPVLAIEVAGEDDDEEKLREKARWYFKNRVEVVWIVLPDEREVVFLDSRGAEKRVRGSARVPEHPTLPDLAPRASDLFPRRRSR